MIKLYIFKHKQTTSVLSDILQTKKPKKVVSDYYKKQNELLENFKNDSEQIQVNPKIFELASYTRRVKPGSLNVKSNGLKSTYSCLSNS